MLETLKEFFSFTDANVTFVMIGSILIGASSAVVGCFSVLRKRALIGDVISHSVLPGICIAFLLFNSKNPFVLLGGAFLSGWLSIIWVDYIERNSNIKSDAAIGIVLSVFFGAGILILTVIQHSGNAAQSGLDHFIFGNIASMLRQDLYVLSGMSLFLLIIILLFYKPFVYISFDRNYAVSLGMPVRFYDFMLSSITVLAVTVGIQAVGVVLMSALLITPAVAARFLTSKLNYMLLIAALISSVCCIIGTFISYTAPSMPTGPWIIVVLMLLSMLAVFFSPSRGILINKWRQQKNYRKILEENVLKLLFQLCEKTGFKEQEWNISQMLDKRNMGEQQLKQTLRRLEKKGLVEKKSAEWTATVNGVIIGKRMVRLHRLWEVYLTQYLKLPSDHVHETAEAMEHILNPELEAQLETILNKPEFDPHNSKIPYQDE